MKLSPSNALAMAAQPEASPFNIFVPVFRIVAAESSIVSSFKNPRNCRSATAPLTAITKAPPAAPRMDTNPPRGDLIRKSTASPNPLTTSPAIFIAGIRTGRSTLPAILANLSEALFIWSWSPAQLVLYDSFADSPSFIEAACPRIAAL